jgi:hypothetical protein
VGGVGAELARMGVVGEGHFSLFLFLFLVLQGLRFLILVSALVL